MFNEICSFENLHSAYLKARKCKRYRDEILKFGFNLEENLLKLQEELLNQSYQHGGYREFIVCDSKKRKIKAAPFRDRVVHHALCNVIESIFDKGFIFDSYACREGKGTHKAVKRLEKFLKSISDRAHRALKNKKIYCLECDISKYFDSINHEILLKIIEKKIADKNTLWLIREILSSSYEKGPWTGIPIGNLTSQLFANVYLNELDQFAKHTLKMGYYIRYMDDFLVLDFDKKKLHKIKKQIRAFLRNKLKLELHPKKANIFPTNKGIDFLGYQVFNTYRLLRKSTVQRFIKRTKTYHKRLGKGLISQEKFNNSLQSWLVYAKRANSWRLRKDLHLKLKVCRN
jgi:RNA-directed DNA polymerase